nr:protein phosphatase 2C domain-containing protein [Leptospiraceae bacterium]
MMIKAFGATDIGKLRENNEDNFLIFRPVLKQEGDIGTDYSTENGVLLLVADGMGGAAAGETASAMAVATAKACLEEYHTQNTSLELMQISILTAQKGCQMIVQDRPELSGMGTVATYVYVKNNKADIAQIGDTRLYLYRNKSLEQLTEDQNLVTELVKAGLITLEQAQYHPQKNAVTQAIGALDDVNPYFYTLEVQKGDILLLCSDGLTNMVSDLEIQLALDSSADLQNIPSILIDTANANGGYDLEDRVFEVSPDAQPAFTEFTNIGQLTDVDNLVRS